MSTRSRLRLSEAQFEAVSGVLIQYTLPLASLSGSQGYQRVAQGGDFAPFFFLSPPLIITSEH